MPYLIKAIEVFFLWIVVLSCGLSSCSPGQHVIETNLPNYQMVGQGNPKNTTVLFFQDPDCRANDSLALYLQQQKYHVIRITKQYKDPLGLLNQDHPKLRGEEGLLILDQLQKKYTIKTIAASGIEVHSIAGWFVNTHISEAYLFPYYPNSLADHLRMCMITGEKYLVDLKPTDSAAEFYELLQSSENPSGRLGNYSYRYYKSIWNLQPKRDLTPYRGEVYYEVLP